MESEDVRSRKKKEAEKKRGRRASLLATRA